MRNLKMDVYDDDADYETFERFGNRPSMKTERHPRRKVSTETIRANRRKRERERQEAIEEASYED